MENLNQIKIGQRFYKTPNKRIELELVDVLNCYSTIDGRFVKSVYIAKPINSLSSNTFEVSRTTIIRNKK